MHARTVSTACFMIHGTVANALSAELCIKAVTVIYTALLPVAQL